MFQHSGRIGFAYRLELRFPLTGFLTRFSAYIAFVWDRIGLTRRLIAFRSALSERVVMGFD